jgi:hypothetical protein
MDAILNALLLASAKSGGRIMQVGFLMALAGVPVMELFHDVGYWQRTRIHCACQWAERGKKSDPGKIPKVVQVLTWRNVVREHHLPARILGFFGRKKI